jgi:UDP:flavonoid glycosyltransferase YjiC (YdhE family)
MATISFFMLSEPGHLNGPIKLAKSLKACGHQIYFLGMPDSEGLIHREGFEFIPVLNSLYRRKPKLFSFAGLILYMIGQGEATRVDLQILLDQAIKATFTREEERFARQDISLMIERIRETKSDLFFADYFLLPIAFITSRLGINSALLNVTLFESQVQYHPLIDPGMEFPSILNIPVVYLCPWEFDPPCSAPNDYQRYYIEPSIDLSRRQEEFQWSLVNEALPLLVCSFGSQIRVYSKAKKVIQTVIDAIALKPEWQMILSLGGALSVEEFNPLPSNVKLLNTIPQLEVLERASIMITHGGLNSVKECIFFGVPMIVIPFDIDQPSNALRVVHHGLGLAENPETISVERLHSMIDRIGQDASFKTRVDLMRASFREIENSGIGVKTVNELLNKPWFQAA